MLLYKKVFYKIDNSTVLLNTMPLPDNTILRTHLWVLIFNFEI